MTKNSVLTQIKDYYDYDNFNIAAVKDITRRTTKEYKLSDYENVSDSYRIDYDKIIIKKNIMMN